MRAKLFAFMVLGRIFQSNVGDFFFFFLMLMLRPHQDSESIGQVWGPM